VFQVGSFSQRFGHSDNSILIFIKDQKLKIHYLSYFVEQASFWLAFFAKKKKQDQILQR